MSFEAVVPTHFAPSSNKICQWLLTVSLLAASVYFFFASIHWPLLEDSPVMHYVVFLTRHGFEPYQTITDNNLPGSYLTESLAMNLFGTGDLAWRLYDFFLLSVATAICVAIAPRRDWLAGLFGGLLFLLTHAADGPNYAVERDELITILMLAAFWLAFSSVRCARPQFLAPFGFAAGMASSIKPTAVPLAAVLLGLTAYVVSKRRQSPWPYVGWASVGFAFAVAVNVAYLARHHAFAAFWFVLRDITPHYVALAHPTFPNMLRNLMPRYLLYFALAIGLPLFALNRGVRRWTWERWALALGAAFGLLSFFAQQKGFVQHRYMFEAFLFLLLGFELVEALRTPGWPHRFAVFAVAVTVLYLVPAYIRGIRVFSSRDVFTESLNRDLTVLGRDRLQGQVFCFDLVYGCINSLYHLQLVENTGYTGDLLLFFPQEGGLATKYYRDMFWRAQSKHPAGLLVMTNQWLQRRNSYDKINTWPDFVTWLGANYTLVKSRSFPVNGQSTGPDAPDPNGYRIYVRNDSALLSEAKQLLEAL